MYNTPKVTSLRPQPHILQYLINELVFGRKIPSESTWKIFILPGIFLCWILGVVPQAQGCCLSKKRLNLQNTNTSRCPSNIVVLHSGFFLSYCSIWDAAKTVTKHHEQTSVQMKYFLPDLQNDTCSFQKNQFQLLSCKEGGVRMNRFWKQQERLTTNVNETWLFQPFSAWPRKWQTSGKWRCNSFALLSGVLLSFLHCTPSSPVHSAIGREGQRHGRLCPY